MDKLSPLMASCSDARRKSRKQLIEDDLTSLLEHGYITPAQAVQSAVTQAYAAEYAAAKRDGQS
jgi:hypothetical protein